MCHSDFRSCDNEIIQTSLNTDYTQNREFSNTIPVIKLFLYT